MNFDYDSLVPLGRRTLIEFSNLAIIVLLFSLALLKFLLLDDSQLSLPAVFLLAGAIANAIYLRSRGATDIGAYILIGLLLAGLITGGVNNYAFSGPIMVLSSLIPIFSMLLLNTRVAWSSLVAVVVILCGMLFFQMNGTIPANPNPPELVIVGRFITVLSLCLLSTWIVWCFARMSRVLLMNIERKSNTDHLTGILNRRGIETALTYEMGRIKRSGGWLSFILADVDHFKLYNDTNGHQAGDDCLIRIAHVLDSGRRRLTDVVGRFGGEEFVIILPDTGSKGALKVAEKIRRAVLDEKISYGPENPDFVSITLGVASVRGEEINNVEELVKLADQALYQGKEQGRNCVVSVVLGESASTVVEFGTT